MGCPSFQQWRPVAALFVVHFFRILISRGVSRFFSFLFLLFVFPSAIFILPFFSLFKLSSSFLSLSLSVGEGYSVDDTLRRIQNDAIFFPLSLLSFVRSFVNRIDVFIERIVMVRSKITMIGIHRANWTIGWSDFFFLFFFIFRGECKRSTLLRLWRMVSFDRCHYRCASLKRSGVVKSIHDWMIFFETKNVSQLAIQVYLKKKKKKKGREKRRRKKR